MTHSYFSRAIGVAIVTACFACNAENHGSSSLNQQQSRLVAEPSENAEFKCSNLSKPPFPFDDKWPSLTTIGNKIVVFGNDDSPGKPGQVGHKVRGAIFDPSLDSWTTIPYPSFPVSNRPKVAAVGDTIYLFGAGYPNGIGRNIAGKYSISAGTWEEISLPFDYLTNSHVNVIDSKIYLHGLVGGYRSGGSWWVYDPSNDKWSEQQKGYLDTLGFSITSGKKIFFIGDDYSGTRVFDSVTGKFENLSRFEAQKRSAGAAVGDKIVVWGGGSSGPEKSVDKGFVYDTKDGSSTPLPKSPFTPRSGQGATAIGEKIVFFGGYRGLVKVPDGKDDFVAVFDLATGKWICHDSK